MRIIRNASRTIVGLVFVFSGFVKAVDPLGTAYKFGDYFEAFGMDFFTQMSLPFALLLISLEFVVGMCMLLGVRMRFFSWVLLVMSTYFLILTFIIALTNPVSDCGCFGDFLIISNWETFIKNVVLIVLTYIIFREKERFSVLYRPVTEWVITGISTFFVLFICVNALNHLPMFDFRPYHIGAHIPTKMEVPEGAPSDVYETTVIYEKNGEQREFSLYDTTWQDGTWKWIETKQKLLKKGVEPEIHDFFLYDKENNDITWDVIGDYNYVFLLISNKINHINVEGYLKAQKLKSFCDTQDGFSFYAVTSDLEEEVDKLKSSTGIDYDFLTADNITLKTIVRSKPGLIVLKEGTILGKWHFKDFPDVNTLKENYMSVVIDDLRMKKNKSQVFLIIFIGVSLVLLGRTLLNFKGK